MDSRRMELQPTHLIKELLLILKETFPKSIQLKMNLAPNLWALAADAIQFDQVLLNLCVNARDAMPAGGTLTVAAENIELGKDCASVSPEARPGSYVMISVADTGMGIPAEIRAKIFTPFFTTKEPGKGTGLGLSTTLGIVKNHAGFINFLSEPGKGTVFRVYLPALAAAKAAGLEPEKPQPHRGNGELVLVVDDEASFRAITKHTLEAFGYQVITACNGAEGISLYSQHQQDCAAVLMDLVMPVTDGLAAIHQLTKMNPQVRVIAASGFVAEGTVAKTASKAVKKFLLKPYTAETLLKTLHEVLLGSPATR
jgi:CheY-like chemotaxis protein